jgi:hypothetical protein
MKRQRPASDRLDWKIEKQKTPQAIDFAGFC